MLRELGVSMSPPNLKPYFTHPLDKKKRVYVLLDVCHMLKLIRNTLGNCGTLVDGDDQEICWKYLTALHELQQDEGLRLGNKLKQAHIKWWQQKMKVNLAAQTLSSRVAPLTSCSISLILAILVQRASKLLCAKVTEKLGKHFLKKLMHT